MMKIPFSPPDISEAEIEAVADTLRSGWITTGPRTKLFEKKLAEYCHTNRFVCLNSATAAAEQTLRVLGVGPGDEVITSAYTYTASASVVCHVGAKVVLVDTAPGSLEMDYDALEKAITEKTKVITPVDIGGVLCDYDRIYEIVKRKQSLFRSANEIQAAIGRIVIMADSAHALGSRIGKKMCGEFADFTTFSFHAVKNLTTAEGGGVTWQPIAGISDEDLYRQYMLLSLHGQSKDALSKTQIGAWEYDIVDPLYKCNMTDIMAAIGLVQMERYPGMLARRKEIFQQYQALLGENVAFWEHFQGEKSSSTHLGIIWVPGADAQRRNEIIQRMGEQGVAANVHYKPLPMMTAYKKLGYDIRDFPNAYHMYENEITLPLNTCMTDEEVAYAARSLMTAMASSQHR